MFKPILKFSSRTVKFALETIVVLALLFAIAFGALMWKLSKGPVSIGWAKDYVEQALSLEGQELSVTFDNMVFSWPDIQGPFQLDLTNLRVQKGNREGGTLRIEKASVGLSRRALFFGRIRPVSVIIESPSLELVRLADGHLNIFIQDKDAAPTPEQKTSAATYGQDVTQIFRDMANHTRGSIISRLDEFVINNASVAIRDYKFGLSWYLTDFDLGIAEHPEGVAAMLNIALPGRVGEDGGVSVNIAYRKETDDFMASGEIKNINPYFLSRFLPLPDVLAGQDLYLSGDVVSALDKNLMPTYINMTGSIPEGQVVLPEEYDAPVALKNIMIKTEYDAGKQVLNIPELSGDIGGVAFTGRGGGSFTDNSFALPIELNVASATLEQVQQLFPKSEHEGDAYEWVGRSMTGGSFNNVALKMELAAQKTRNEELQRDQWSVDTSKLTLDFGFEGQTVTYNHTLMPAEDVKGRGTLDLAAETLEIHGERARIGDIEGRDVNVKVTDLLKAAAGYVTIDLQAKGPVSTALKYIAADPINMGEDEIGIDASKVKGVIDAKVKIALPTVKDVPKEQVNVDIDGVLTEMNLPDAVEGLALSGGPLNLKTEPGGFKIKGNAQLAGRDTILDWHQFFESKGNPYSMQVTASVGADQELRNHFGVNLDEYISGTMPVDVTYTDKGDGNTTIDVKGDLNPVRIYIDPFKFEKPVGMPGTITAKGTLKNDALKELTNIELKSRDFSVSGAKLGFAPMNGKSADLANGSLPGVKLGKTNMDVTFDVTKDNVMKVNAKGPVFDLGPFLQESESSDISVTIAAPKEKQQAMNIALSADTMLAANNQSVRAAKVYMEMDTDGDITRIELDGVVGKQGNLFVRFKPDNTGKRTFRLESNDAGNVLYAFGLYENIHGGTLLIYGEPKGNDARGDLYGSMRMENFRVVKAPALASLLSLMSLSGVGQLLGNEGLVFSKLESNYEWRFRPDGNLLIIKDGKTSGSSVGLTFEGVVDRGKKTTDVSGTIIPMTEVNSIIAAIPLVGDLLGGTGGLIAATYTMKGPTSDPQVMVNPLSVLAPGFLRRILFEGGYESKIPEDTGPAPQNPMTRGTSAPSSSAAPNAPNANPKPSNTVKSNPAPTPSRTVAPKVAN